MINSSTFKKQILRWVSNLKVQGTICQYRFSLFTDDSIFTTCFALFIWDLFGEIDHWDTSEKEVWVEYIQGFQNPGQGYFEPQEYFRGDPERARYQLTCFCLSALDILKAEPLHPLRFVERWDSPAKIKKALYGWRCHLGAGGSGNKAMFLAIFLTCLYKKAPASYGIDNIKAWFEFHDQFQNRNGFWGNSLESNYSVGFQNGYHQILIYEYWKRDIKKLDRIVNVILNFQGNDGHFAATPGGESCWDYDASHILLLAYDKLNVKKEQIRNSLARLYDAIIKNQNADYGFCASRMDLFQNREFAKIASFVLNGSNPYYWYYRGRKCAGLLLKREKSIYTGWTRLGRQWDESNLWDTWMRSLSLSEISKKIDYGEKQIDKHAKSHQMVGIGYYEC